MFTDFYRSEVTLFSPVEGAACHVEPAHHQEVSMRSPAEMDIIQIDISTKCHFRCSNCTRLMAHQVKREDMPLKKFEHAVKSMEGWQGPGNILGVIAGEPTLHAE